MSISINQINYAIALHETGSFSQAANLCHVTQSTLSTMIKRLEDHLEVKLFERNLKPIKVTKAGEQIIYQFQIIQNEFNNLLDITQNAKDEFSGNLKIGIIPTLAPFLLPLILDTLVKDYPKMNFNIFEITTQEIISRLKLREIDIGILALPLKHKDIEETSLFKEEFLVYDARNLRRGKKEYKIQEIDASKLWLLEESHCLTHQVGKICHLKKQQKIKESVDFKSGSIHSLLELVNISQGITLLPKLATIQNKLINDNLLYKIKGSNPVREIGIVNHKSNKKEKLIKLLEQKIISIVKPIVGSKRKFDIIEPF